MKQLPQNNKPMLSLSSFSLRRFHAKTEDMTHNRYLGIVIKFISIELTCRVSSIFPLKLIVFISSALISRPIFSFSFTSEATTPVKLDSMRRTSGCERKLDRLSSCEVNHIRRVDTEEDQHDFCRFYPRSYLSQSVMFLLSAK